MKKKTVRKWQQQPENVNCTVNKFNFCKVFQLTLEGYEMTGAIINGFKKCGLYPLNPENVDYLKCVQNIMEDLQNKNKDEQILCGNIQTQELQAAEKVIQCLKNRLFYLGIDADIIINEIKSLKNQQHKPIEVGTTIDLDDALILPYETVILENELNDELDLFLPYNDDSANNNDQSNPNTNEIQSITETPSLFELPSYQDEQTKENENHLEEILPIENTDNDQPNQGDLLITDTQPTTETSLFELTSNQD